MTHHRTMLSVQCNQAITSCCAPKPSSLKRSTVAVFQNSAELMGFWLLLELILVGENADLVKSRHSTEPFLLVLFIYLFLLRREKKSRKVSTWNLFSFLTAHLPRTLTAHQVERHPASAVYYPDGARGPQASNWLLESSVARPSIYLNL